MSPAFSIVYPTRHRPAFIEQALRILERQEHDDFEVIVSDNFDDPDRSCADACARSRLGARIRYVRPPQPLGMVDNWTHALASVRGDYVLFLTDKMFVLPDALARIGRAIDEAGEPEIVSWTSDAYNPSGSDDPLGDGTYVRLSPSDPRPSFHAYSPAEELDRRGRASVSRPELSPADYGRGKLVFGAYRRTLIERVEGRFGTLFHNINPDYTSMVLGLSEARSAIELHASCVVGVNTDVSNGFQTDANDAAMRAFLDSLEGGIAGILADLPVPGVYVSQHNCVGRDYLHLRQRYDLAFAFDPVSWTTYCHEDVHRPTRVWSTPGVEAEQKGLLAAFLSAHPSLAASVERRLADRSAPRGLGLGTRIRRRLTPPRGAEVIRHASVLEAVERAAAASR